MSIFKELRMRSGITQKEASEILNVAPRTYQDWELGNRNPKNQDEIIEKLEALTILTREGINSILNGFSDIEWAVFEKKLQDVKTISKWGSFGSTFDANWNRIPKDLKEKLPANELAELVDAIKVAYDDGVQAGKGIR